MTKNDASSLKCAYRDLTQERIEEQKRKLYINKIDLSE